MYEMDEIEAEAERLAPYPKAEPSHAGITGFSIAGLILAIFCGPAGMNLDDHPGPRIVLAFLVTLAVGFTAPFIYFDRQKRRHFKVWAQLRARNRNA